MSVAPVYKRDDGTPYSVESQAGDAGACFAGERQLAHWHERALQNALGLIEAKRAEMAPAQLAAATYDAAISEAHDAVLASLSTADPSQAAALALQASDALARASEAGAPYGASVPEDAYNAVAQAMTRAQSMQPHPDTAAAIELAQGPRLAEPAVPGSQEKPPFPWLLVAMTLFGMGT